ncbi:DNA-binding transcriptional regulator, MarR family [Haloechinothrix alba]|uniref:DNA-binding transcriptional regulator, MarR family n=1 Tax=Haloechinothrix alba TaxID=664784 RepID=A0A238XDE7_9PSEU|nr:MarR family transcriptional regulator [Haloechinothrix alba]SNR56628.1 DNA-binding transcriptional regulator, MarR family [Haloechinothrix alba]
MADAGQERTLASRLRLAVVRLNRRLRAQRLSTNVSLTQLSALSTLHKCGAMTPGQLAAKEGVQPPSMTRVIVALEQLGYIARTAHPTDGRQAIVELSQAGVDYVHANITMREAWLDERLAQLSEEERAVLARAAEIIERMAAQ